MLKLLALLAAAKASSCHVWVCAELLKTGRHFKLGSVSSKQSAVQLSALVRDAAPLYTTHKQVGAATLYLP